MTERYSATTGNRLYDAYTYDAFGNQKSTNSNDVNPFRYCGEYWDKESGSYYLRARYYDPSIGRFTQEDTHRGSQRDSLSLHLYNYCVGNPGRFHDRTGHIPVETILDFIDLGISGAELISNPNGENLVFFLWDLGALFIPYLPGAYAGKGLKLLGKADDAVDAAKRIRYVSKTDDAADIIKALNRADNAEDAASIFKRAKEHIVGSYKDIKKLVKSFNMKGLEVHHLIEKRFAAALGITKREEILSVALDHDTHAKITSLFRKKIGYINDKKAINTFSATPQIIWDTIVDIYREVGAEEYLPLLKD